jgi:recombination protein RecA
MPTAPPEDSQKDKQKALSLALQQIEKSFGKGAIMRLGDGSRIRVETVPSGALTLDLALGGGLPKGRVVEIYGPESSGKTTVALHAIAEVQKRGGIAAFVDAEHALDPDYAAALGVDVQNLLVSQPDHGEAALEIVDSLVRSAAVDIIVVDSVAALVPKAEIEGEMGDAYMGLQARLMSQALRKITGNISKTGCIVIFLNQLRQKNWRHLRQPGNHHWRQRPQILRLCAFGCAPYPNPKKRHRRVWHPGQSQSRQKQSRSPFSDCRI